MKLVIEIDEKDYNDVVNACFMQSLLATMRNVIKDGTPLPLLKGQWIPVSEKLPETVDDVLAYDGSDYFVAWYEPEGPHMGWWSNDDTFDRYSPVRAWMLIEPYKADKFKSKGEN